MEKNQPAELTQIQIEDKTGQIKTAVRCCLLLHVLVCLFPCARWCVFTGGQQKLEEPQRLNGRMESDLLNGTESIAVVNKVNKIIALRNFLFSESDSEDESSTSKKAKTTATPPAPTAPKNNKPCFKCNQPGHFAKDCANEATCYKCKKVRRKQSLSQIV